MRRRRSLGPLSVRHEVTEDRLVQGGVKDPGAMALEHEIEKAFCSFDSQFDDGIGSGAEDRLTQRQELLWRDSMPIRRLRYWPTPRHAAFSNAVALLGGRTREVRMVPDGHLRAAAMAEFGASFVLRLGERLKLKVRLEDETHNSKR